MSEPSLLPLLELVKRLRAPDGCPWDREQTLASARGYLLEEAHEVAAAIDGGNLTEIAAELGDLLFQTVFVAALVEEDGGANLQSVLEAIRAKMVARHPHVFEDLTLDTPAEVNRLWESRKALEKDADASILDGVPSSLPALLTAYRMTQKAAGVGFDWPDIGGVLAKIEEELGELRAALCDSEDPSDPHVTEEAGDLLFAVANLSRHLGADPEGVLAATNRKFRRRFSYMERELAAQGRRLGDTELADLDRLWERAKELEDDRRSSL